MCATSPYESRSMNVGVRESEYECDSIEKRKYQLLKLILVDRIFAYCTYGCTSSGQFNSQFSFLRCVFFSLTAIIGYMKHTYEHTNRTNNILIYDVLVVYIIDFGIFVRLLSGISCQFLHRLLPYEFSTGFRFFHSFILSLVSNGISNQPKHRTNH